MNQQIQAVLDALETIMTEVDLELWQWQADIDMLSLAGVEIPLVYYVFNDAVAIASSRLIHDGGALIMYGEDIVKPEEDDHAAWRYIREHDRPYFDEPRDPLPLVMYRNGKKEEIGFAHYTVLPNGDIVARGEVTKFIPELHEPAPKLSIGYDRELERPSIKPWAKRVSFEKLRTEVDGLNPTIRAYLLDPDKHRFFKENNNGS